MSNFYQKLTESFSRNINNYYTDNHDEDRFGPAPKEKKSVAKQKVKKLLLKNRVSIIDLKHYLTPVITLIGKYGSQLDKLYNALADDESKELLIDIVSLRIMDNRKIKLKINNADNRKILEAIRKTENANDLINPEFLHFKLSRFDLRPLGKNVQLYFFAKGILIDFFLEQYRYKNNSVDISAKKDDVVIDAGGCWGDTALYFADCVGENGTVYSFEFIPNNLEILKKNRDLNTHLSSQIKVVEKPLGINSGKKIYYKDYGPSSKVELENFNGASTTETISIDDFVSINNIERVDFIKMDIEGSELPTLEGAKATIKKYKPQLAISIYHSWDDFVNIPTWILNLGLDYKIYLGHYTIHAEETVIFATTR